MMAIDLQSQCELGQQHLMAMRYLEAEKALSAAEEQAWSQHDFDTLARLYMPLQEARRQRRQRCGEGIVRLDLLAENALDFVDPRHVIENYPQGQLLVAGWASAEPARLVRAIQAELDLYLDTFLAAVYPLKDDTRAIAVIPLLDVPLPDAQPRSIAELTTALPPHSLIFRPDDLPAGAQKGSSQTYGMVMNIWEQLHAPFLAAADSQTDPIRKMELYRRTIQVDYACELAHQKLSDVAKNLAHEK
ncbi:MAG: hypothetical protein IT447_00565 [Phycisphaerales bacterium]|jgi:hypothetical protein|nr:hypothetical protein [Phycisphaerales bacterium]